MVRSVLLCVLLLPEFAIAQTLSGTVQVVDGDSLSLSGQSVRLFGIDAPEGEQTCIRESTTWACGEESANQLRLMIANNRVECRGQGNDDYGRIVAVCWANGYELNKTMVRQGWATAFQRYSDAYAADETMAKAEHRCIWTSTFELPEQYRLGHQAPQRERQISFRSQPRRAPPVSSSFQGCVIKGNRNRKGQWIYHLPGMPYYDVTRAEEIFCTEAEAQVAGYRRAIVRPLG